MKFSGYLFLSFLTFVCFLILFFLGTDYFKFKTRIHKTYQEENSIKIATSADDNFIEPLSVFLTSLSLNTKTPVQVVILTRGFNEKNTLIIQSLQKSLKNIKISPLYLSNNIDFKDFSVKSRWNETIYYRYLIINHPYFQTLDKIIYLDSDIVVLKDLKDYYDIDLKDNFLAGRRDLNAYQNQRLKFPFKTNLYVNAGSLLLNLKKMRIQNIQPLLFETTYKYNNIFYYADQDVINYLFKGKIKELPPKYNGNIILETPFNKTIYHYLGDSKPWKEYSIDFHEWYKYQAYKNAILNDENFPLKDYFIYLIDKIMYYYQFLINTAVGI